MAILSDSIEQFIKEMLTGDAGELELKRGELAGRFGCAPSQINYVLATRFTPERGYIVESRRGGGGGIRIVRVLGRRSSTINELLARYSREGLTEMQARSIIIGLKDAGIVSEREAVIMAGAISDNALIRNAADAEGMRRDILRSMMTALLKEDR